MSEIVNRVDQSKIVTLDLGNYYPQLTVAGIDLKDWLYKELILREKEFRQSVKEHDWSLYDGKAVYVHCSVDAILPVWAWMLVQTALSGHAEEVVWGSEEDMLTRLFRGNLQKQLNIREFIDKPVVIKGCGDRPVPPGVFMEAVKMLVPHVRSIMYGEPCSTVPVYKKAPVRRHTRST